MHILDVGMHFRTFAFRLPLAYVAFIVLLTCKTKVTGRCHYCYKWCELWPQCNPLCFTLLHPIHDIKKPRTHNTPDTHIQTTYKYSSLLCSVCSSELRHASVVCPALLHEAPQPYVTSRSLFLSVGCLWSVWPASQRVSIPQVRLPSHTGTWLTHLSSPLWQRHAHTSNKCGAI